MYKETAELSNSLESLNVFIEEIKSSIKPSDARLLQQGHTSLSQRQVELLDDLSQLKAEAEQKLDLLPIFDTKYAFIYLLNLSTTHRGNIIDFICSWRCKNWLLWVKDAKDRLERPSTQNLEDYLTHIETELHPELAMKMPAFQSLSRCGDDLVEMTAGKEKKELVRILKEVRGKWNELYTLVEQRNGRVNHLLKVT